MKIQRWHKLIAFTLLMAGGTLTLRAQTYLMDWFKIAGGGGTSAGGSYSVSGTIGQPDASAQTMTGGNYSGSGGFLAFYAALQTPGAPKVTPLTTSTHTPVVDRPWPSTGRNPP